MTCALCDEPMGDEPSASVVQPMHRACALRSTMGGIGHLIAHDYWCEYRHDPDAGLTYRQSALLVDEFVAIVGVSEAMNRYRAGSGDRRLSNGPGSPTLDMQDVQTAGEVEGWVEQ